MPARAEVESRRPSIQQSPEASRKDGHRPDMGTIVDLIVTHNQKTSFKDDVPYSAVNLAGLESVVGQVLDGGSTKEELTEKEKEVALSAAQETPGQYWFSWFDVAEAVSAVNRFRSGKEELPTPERNRTQVSFPDSFPTAIAAQMLGISPLKLRVLIRKMGISPLKQGGGFVFSLKDIRYIGGILEERRLEKARRIEEDQGLLERRDVAIKLGLGRKTLGRICRLLGFPRWERLLTPEQAQQVRAYLEQQNKEKMKEATETPKRRRGKPFYPTPPNYVSISEAKRLIGVKSSSTVVEYANRAGIALLREHGKAFVPKDKLGNLRAARRQNRQKVSGDIDHRIEREDVALDLGIPVKEVNAICRQLGLNRKGPLSPEGYQRVEEHVKNQQ